MKHHTGLPSPEEVQRRVNHTRGEIIQQHITCESLISTILFHYYKGYDKIHKSRIYDDLIVELPIRKKVKLLHKILKEYDIPKANKIKKRLEQINSVRHQMAHVQWDMILDDKITFPRKNKSDKIEINEEFLKKYKTKIIKIERELLNFLKETFDPYNELNRDR